jgi:carbon monoxide dehydrogenase subunit G
MTKKLQELFELPNDDSDINEIEVNHSNIKKAEADLITKDAYSNLEKIENALPQVKGLESADEEMDALAELAVSSYKDLQDLGMQVDSRFSAEIFSVAGAMLGHAITAKTAKLNKKLKMIELQLKKAALDQKAQNKEQEIDNIPVGEGKALDRNELLKMLTQNSKD